MKPRTSSTKGPKQPSKPATPARTKYDVFTWTGNRPKRYPKWMKH